MSKKAHFIIGAMQPDFTEYADDTQFHYWMDYACELDEITLVNARDGNVTEYLNKRMAKYSSNHAVHHACTDVASTLESLMPEYKGVFKYN